MLYLQNSVDVLQISREEPFIPAIIARSSLHVKSVCVQLLLSETLENDRRQTAKVHAAVSPNLAAMLDSH